MFNTARFTEEGGEERALVVAGLVLFFFKFQIILKFIHMWAVSGVESHVDIRWKLCLIIRRNKKFLLSVSRFYFRADTVFDIVRRI